MKGCLSEPDAGEDRDEDPDEGGEDNEGPWGGRTKAWRRLGDEPKTAFQLRGSKILSRDRDGRAEAVKI